MPEVRSVDVLTCELLGLTPEQLERFVRDYPIRLPRDVEHMAVVLLEHESLSRAVALCRVYREGWTKPPPQGYQVKSDPVSRVSRWLRWWGF